jgi:hypothetical protein
MSLRAIITPRLPEPQAEEARRVLVESVRELQALPASSLTVIPSVELADGALVSVAHKIGRAPLFVACSAPRGPAAAGYIEEVRDGTDRKRVVVLRATGYGATVTVDVVAL